VCGHVFGASGIDFASLIFGFGIAFTNEILFDK
jgi:hypothetical protein